jgi:hypothetical protein
VSGQCRGYRAELGSYLVRCAGGGEAISAIMRDDIGVAPARGDYRHAAELKLVLHHFVERCRPNPALCGGWIELAGAHS